MAHILVADDDDLQTALLEYKLQSGGHTVCVVDDGESALEAIKDRSFDLVVLDGMMPVMSGFEVLARLRGDPRHQDLPIIMLTSRKSQDDVVRALEAGANDYITKPFIPAELLIRVNAILRTGDGSARLARGA